MFRWPHVKGQRKWKVVSIDQNETNWDIYATLHEVGDEKSIITVEIDKLIGSRDDSNTDGD